MVHETSPQPVIENDYIVVSRPSLRLFAYCRPEPADLARAPEIVELLRGPLRELVTVCSGTLLSPKKRRHATTDRDWDALGKALEPDAAFAGFTLYGDADLDDPPFALPMFRILRGSSGFTIEFAFRPDVDVEWVDRTVWPVMRRTEPVQACFGWGVLPYISGYKHACNVAARHKARYRAALCLDAEMMASVVLNDGLAENIAGRTGTTTVTGIADLGWKTIIGESLVARIDRTALEASDAAIADTPGGGVEIVVGDRPLWGDVNAGANDLLERRRPVLAALHGALASREMLRRFAGLDDSHEAADIIDAYVSDWAPPGTETAR